MMACSLAWVIQAEEKHQIAKQASQCNLLYSPHGDLVMLNTSMPESGITHAVSPKYSTLDGWVAITNHHI